MLIFFLHLLVHSKNQKYHPELYFGKEEIDTTRLN